MRLSRILVVALIAGLIAAPTATADAQITLSATTSYKFGRPNQQDDIFGAYAPTASYLGLTISGMGFTTTTVDGIAALNTAVANLGTLQVAKVAARYNSRLEYLYVKLNFAAPTGVPDSLYFVGLLRDGTATCPVFIGFAPSSRCPACENAVLATLFEQSGTDDGDSYQGGTFDMAIDDQFAGIGNSYLTGSIDVHPEIVEQLLPQFQFGSQFDEPTPTPEPASLTLLATGIVGIVIVRRKRA